MQKYGHEFESIANRPGWWAARGVEGDAAETAANQIHAEFDLGKDLVFCGLSLSEQKDKLFLIELGDPAEVAREFEVGSHSDTATVQNVTEMLQAIFRIVPFSPTLLNTSCYHARFTQHINEQLAERVSHTIDKYGCEGMDWYVSSDLCTNEEIIASMVSEQRFHLWWD